MAQCKRAGWTDGQWVDANTLAPLTVEEVIARKWTDVKVLERITAAGLDALGVPRCAQCGVPMNSSTAFGREDGLLCDKCTEQCEDPEIDSAVASETPN